MKCIECSVEFVPKDKRNGKFCGRSCAAKFNNRAVPKRKRSQYYNCKLCGANKSANSSEYCRDCYHTEQYEQYIARWLAGEESGVSGKEGTSSRIRRWLMEQAGGVCERCGWSEVNPSTGKVPVQINHINGRWDDNRPENLEIICPNCHSLTPNYGGLNKGNGRRGRYT